MFNEKTTSLIYGRYGGSAISHVGNPQAELSLK